MNLRDLKYFVALAETRHFGRAADRCFVGQPTLSVQIRKLEEELGVTLFERAYKAVAITPVGEVLLAHARRAVQEAEALSQQARALRDPVAGPLRVGVIPTLSPYLMPHLLIPLRQSYPQLKLVLHEEITDTLLGRLREHTIDAALLATAVDDPELAAQPLFDEPFWLAHPRGHALYLKETLTREDLESVQLLLLDDGHCLAHQIMEVCRFAARSQAGDMADLRASSLETLLQLVAAGFGCTLVPALAIRGSWTTDMGVIARPLDVPDAFRRVSLVWRRTFPRKSALHAFAEVVCGHLPNTVRRLCLRPESGEAETGEPETREAETG